MDKNTLEEIMIEISDNIPNNQIVITSGKMLGTGEILNLNAINMQDDYLYTIKSFPKSKQDAEKILNHIINTFDKFDSENYDVDFKLELLLKHRV